MMLRYGLRRDAELMPAAHRAGAPSHPQAFGVPPVGDALPAARRKSQVSVEYRNGRPHKVHAVVIAAQHEDSVSTEQLRESVNSEVIDKVVPPELRAPDMKRWVNATRPLS